MGQGKAPIFAHSLGRWTFDRRDFLRGISSSVAFSACARFAGALSPPPYPFDVIPGDVTGITWKHTAGHSEQKYLPETTGAGCAFLDYDNDGWMDILSLIHI